MDGRQNAVPNLPADSFLGVVQPAYRPSFPKPFPLFFCMRLYQAAATIRALTETAVTRYGRDTSVSLNAFRSPAASSNARSPVGHRDQSVCWSKRTENHIVKKIILATLGAVALVSSFTAFAGPDFYVIEKARADKHAEAQHQAACDAATMNNSLLPMPIAEAALDYSAVSVDSPGDA
ncbi:conserved hypothetical protein [Cupriavidus taiwanensis]|nr:conserved hypothetical protein [Cupriavidus taiwanensis]